MRAVSWLYVSTAQYDPDEVDPVMVAIWDKCWPDRHGSSTTSKDASPNATDCSHGPTGDAEIHKS
jgi:hypothetical protein